MDTIQEVGHYVKWNKGMPKPFLLHHNFWYHIILTKMQASLELGNLLKALL
jgi:hypothetical protein